MMKSASKTTLTPACTACTSVGFMQTVSCVVISGAGRGIQASSEGQLSALHCKGNTH